MNPLYYHAHHQYHGEDLPFWQAIAGRFGGPVLELGCGTGRVLLHLAEKGWPMVGVDNDPEMLGFLNSTVLQTVAGKVELQEADMRSLNLMRLFPLVILPCNTLSTFPSADRRQIFERVGQHLLPGGKFVFSMPNPEALLELPEVGERELEEEFPHPDSGQPVQVFSRWLRVGDEKITFFWEYTHPGLLNPVVEEASTTHLLDSLEIYLTDLHAAGLAVEEIYGDFEGTEFEPGDTYWIVVAGLSNG